MHETNRPDGAASRLERFFSESGRRNAIPDGVLEIHQAPIVTLYRRDPRFIAFARSAGLASATARD